MDDLLGFATQWLLIDCEVPVCGGADLDGDGDVDLADLAVLATRWLQAS